MTEEQQLKAIAEACGWQYDDGSVFFVRDGDILGIPWPSLDAMHEAEKLLMQKGLWYRYCDTLTGMFREHGNYSTAFMHATAAQRAEAFLRSLNLWTE